MTRSTRHLCFAACVPALALALSTTAALAQTTYSIQGGRTAITLLSRVTGILTNAKITVAPTNAAQLGNGVLYFPITSGVISPTTPEGQIIHSGGFVLTSGATSVRFDSLVIDNLSGAPVVTALVSVNGSLAGRLKLFDVGPPSDLVLSFVPEDGAFLLSNLQLTLDQETVTVLGQSFSLKFLPAGTEMGQAQSVVFLPLISGKYLMQE